MIASPLRRLLTLALLGLLVLAPGRAEAGLFKNLLDKIGKTMEDYNRDMWTGENSLGKTVLKHEGGFFKTFEATAAAMQTAQDNALANVKAVWEAVKDIVLWLPRKLKEKFNQLIGKLNGMNQGATVKDRWNNLVGAAGAPSSMAELGLRASVSADEDEAPADAPAAPSASPAAPSSQEAAFGEMFDMCDSIDDSSKQKEAKSRVRKAFFATLEQRLAAKQVQPAAALIKASAPLYRGDPDGMQRSMTQLSQRYPQYAKGLTQGARRMANMAKRASH